MNEAGKTAIFVVVAVVLCGAAWLSRPAPPTLDYFSDQGEPFYPDFSDPLAAASLEVIEFNEESGAAKPFKVEVKDGVWSIPSHYSYPADGEDRLAKTAAGVIDLRKDIVQSDRAQDHEALGLIDPLDDATPTLKGRGQRVTLRDQAGSVLADFVFGNPVEGRTDFRYARIPGKKRTYGVKADIDISTRFADWIETNLLDVTSGVISSIEINDYSIDESTGTVDAADKVQLEQGDGNKWSMQRLPTGKELDESKVNQMASALSRITITGVRPKPEPIRRDLQAKQGLKLDPFTSLTLRSKGFFVSRDGRLLSNEGEVRVGTKDGVRYTLRFGEVIFGDGLEVSAGVEEGSATDDDEEKEEKPESGPENRYLFVTAGFDETLLPPRPTPPGGYGGTSAEEEGEPAASPDDEPPLLPDSPTSAPADAPTTAPAQDEQEEQAEAKAEEYEKDLQEWEKQEAKGRKLAEKLNERFAPWYYVISASDFKNIRLNRDGLVKEKPKSDDD